MSFHVSSYHTSAPSAPRDFSLSGKGLKRLPEDLHEILEREDTTHLDLSSNQLSPLPPEIGNFGQLLRLDVSQNNLKEFPPEICRLQHLRVLVAKHNQMKGLPTDFGQMKGLEELNLSGNGFEHFPAQITELTSLTMLHLGANFVRRIPPEIAKLQRLTFLYLGGNRLTHVPSELGELSSLSALILCGNQLQFLPKELTKLSNLQSLRLHDNQLQTLPQGLMKLTNLRELSLRNNPLVLRFVKEWPNTVPTLLELSGRCVKKNSIPYTRELIPGVLVEYLNRAQHCDNPQCNGVYFTSRVQSVKFVDFCGKYRVPLMHYLCSAMCVSDDTSYSSSSEDEADEAAKYRMKKVLLG